MNLENAQQQFIIAIKNKIRATQYEALKVVNTHLINLYWELGKEIAQKQAEGWGKTIVPKLSKELQKEFPKMDGFSTTNLWYMVQFYAQYSADANLQPLVGEISWSKHLIIWCSDLQHDEYIAQ